MSLCFSYSSGEATRMTFFEFKVCFSLFLRLQRVTASLRRHVRPPCSRRVRRANARRSARAEEKFMSSACSPPLPPVHQLEPSSGWFIHSESSDSSRLCRNTTQKKTNTLLARTCWIRRPKHNQEYSKQVDGGSGDILQSTQFRRAKQ